MAIDELNHPTPFLHSRIVRPRRRRFLPWSALYAPLGRLGLLASLLQSVFVSGGSMALVGGLAFLASTVVSSSRRIRSLILIALLSTFFIALTSTRTDLPLAEIGKGAIGMFLFFATLIAAPPALIWCFTRKSKVLVFGGLTVALAFIFEWLGLLSLKSIGIVSWFQTNYYLATFDDRPSGLYSEPSWHALAAGALTWALLKQGSRASIAVALLLVVTILLSGSSTGISICALVCLQVLWMLIQKPRDRRIRVMLAATLVMVTVVVVVTLVLWFSDLPAVQKLLNPLAYGSGEARFSQPWPIIRYTWAEYPLFGAGLSFITERLLGLSGFAVLPMNVFVEMGIAGVCLYGAFLFTTIIRYRSSLLDILAAVLCLISLGLPYSPFQAVMLALFLTRRVR